MEFPTVAEANVGLNVRVEGKTSAVRHSSLNYNGRKNPWVLSSGLLNARHITIPLRVTEDTAQDKKGKDKKTPGEKTPKPKDPTQPQSKVPNFPPQPYTVRLLFSRPATLQAAPPETDQQVDVRVSGQTTHSKSATLSAQTMSSELIFERVMLTDDIQITLKNAVGAVGIAGIELKRTAASQPTASSAP